MEPIQGGCATHLRGFSWPVATGWIGVEDEGERRASEGPFGPVSKHGKTPIDRFPRNGDTPPVRRNEDEQPSSVQTSNRPRGRAVIFEPNFQGTGRVHSTRLTRYDGGVESFATGWRLALSLLFRLSLGGFYLIETIKTQFFWLFSLSLSFFLYLLDDWSLFSRVTEYLCGIFDIVMEAFIFYSFFGLVGSRIFPKWLILFY